MSEGTVNQPHDYGEHAQTVGDAGKVMADLNNLVREARKIESEITDKEVEVKEAKKRLDSLTRDALPTAMKAAGVEEFTTSDGLLVKINDKVAASITGDRNDEACNWLEENGHSDVIKREVTIAFAVNEGDLAKEVAEALQREHNRTVINKRTVHPSTLKSLIKRLLDGGKPFPKDLFGVFEFSVAEFKDKSKKK